MIYSSLAKQPLVGLDIGSSYIKAAQIKISKKRIFLEKFGMAKTPSEAIKEGHINSLESIAHVIKKLFNSLNIKKKKVAVSIGGHSVVIKNISILEASENELQEILDYEAEQYIPYEIEDAYLDYKILEKSSLSRKHMNVLLVAARKELIARYVSLIQLAQLNPKIIDVDIFALQNIYQTIPGFNSAEIVLLMDVGASKTSMNIFKANEPLMIRDNIYGTNQIVEKLKAELRISSEEAESMLLLDNDERKRLFIKEPYREIVDLWCFEAVECINSFQTNAYNEYFDKILICGGGALIPSFREELQAKTKMRVMILNPFSGLIVNSKMLPDSDLLKIGAQGAVALGLALRQENDR